MIQLLVHTDLLIDIANNDESAKLRLAQESQIAILCISTITVMEMTIGCRNKTEQQALTRFLAQFAVRPLTEAISAQATELIQT